MLSSSGLEQSEPVAEVVMVASRPSAISLFDFDATGQRLQRMPDRVVVQRPAVAAAEGQQAGAGQHEAYDQDVLKIRGCLRDR